jgi:hypothetical protein
MRQRRPISQREARKLKKRVEELEQRERARISRYSSDFPGGIHVQTLNLNEVPAARLQTAAKLEHALVGRVNGNELYIYAVEVKKP